MLHSTVKSLQNYNQTIRKFTKDKKYKKGQTGKTETKWIQKSKCY